MPKSAGDRRAQTIEEAARYAWLHDSAVQTAGCLTVSAGSSLDAVAGAFGIDPRGPVSGAASAGRASVASIVETRGATVVVEDIGSEGTREVVMKAASDGGLAASVYWDVDSMVVVTCASRGAVVFTGEIDSLDEDERGGLPRGLGRFLDLAQEDDADALSAGAAMVAAYVGVDFGPEVVDEQWRVLVPVTAELEDVTPESSALRHHDPGVLLALAAVPVGRRRELTRRLVAHAAARASLDRDRDILEVLASISDAGPGTVTERLVDRERRASDAMDALQDALIEDDDLDEVEHQERFRPVARVFWLISAVRHACGPDDLSALLGVVECSRILHALDDLGPAYLGAVRRACAAPPDEVASVLASLGTPPDADERRRSRADRRAQRLERDQTQGRPIPVGLDAWNGVNPSKRMRRSGHAAEELAQTDPGLLVALDRLSDDRLRAVATATAEQVLAAAGLLDRPWLQDQRAALGTPLREEDVTAFVDALFAAMDDDQDISWTTHVDDDGEHVSQQHFAVPVLAQARGTEALGAAASAICTAYDALGPDAVVLVARIRERFGLG